jgi:transcriptional regulator with XRE-family HTH domain
MSRSATSEAYQIFIRELIAHRKAAGVTQVELAARLDKPQSYVSKIERRERRIDVIEFCVLAEALGFQPSVLLQEIEAHLDLGLNEPS